MFGTGFWRKGKGGSGRNLLFFRPSGRSFYPYFGTFYFCGLLWKAEPILHCVSLTDLLFSSSWRPTNNEFGMFVFMVSTLAVTFLAMLIAVPVCLLVSVYLSEYAGRRFREFSRFVIDLLAGIPSVIYGLCGVLVIVPWVGALGDFLGIPTTGYSVLAGSLVLAIMVIPFIISISVEVLRMIPDPVRECALALGTTRWETIKYVLLRKAGKGLLAAVVLGFSRAFGETMAVLMVVGNVPRMPSSVLDPAYPLPALIANNYGEVMSVPLYDAALMSAALILMLVVAMFTLTAHYTLQKMGETFER